MINMMTLNVRLGGHSVTGAVCGDCPWLGAGRCLVARWRWISGSGWFSSRLRPFAPITSDTLVGKE